MYIYVTLYLYIYLIQGPGPTLGGEGGIPPPGGGRALGLLIFMDFHEYYTGNAGRCQAELGEARPLVL